MRSSTSCVSITCTSYARVAAMHSLGIGEVNHDIGVTCACTKPRGIAHMHGSGAKGRRAQGTANAEARQACHGSSRTA